MIQLPLSSSGGVVHRSNAVSHRPVLVSPSSTYTSSRLHLSRKLVEFAIIRLYPRDMLQIFRVMLKSRFRSDSVLYFLFVQRQQKRHAYPGLSILTLLKYSRAAFLPSFSRIAF